MSNPTEGNPDSLHDGIVDTPGVIEIIHGRDPDSECDIRVFIDGVDATDSCRIETADPGAGWERREWKSHVRQALDGLSPAARTYAESVFDAASESKYVGTYAESVFDAASESKYVE